MFPQRFSGMGLRAFGDRLRCASHDQAATLVSPLGTEVEHPIRAFDDIEMMFDHKDRVARLDQALETIEQALNVSQVQTRRRFVKNVEIVAAPAHLAKFSRELDALRLATGENRGGVAEFKITEAKLVEDFELSHDRPLIFEEADAFLDREFQHLGDVAPLPGDLQRLFAITASFASGAG